MKFNLKQYRILTGRAKTMIEERKQRLPSFHE